MRRRRRRGPTLAEQADKYALYQRAVQMPEHEVDIFGRFYRDAYGSRPRVLREDFCGTAAICAEWVRGRSDRHAFGIDLDPVPLAWGMEHNVAPLTEREQDRLALVRGDVRTVRTPPADVLSAQNFSFYTFQTRRDLVTYFRAAHRNLRRRGIFVLDMLGGPDVLKDDTEEERKVARFKYVWEQVSYEPIHNHAVFRIHFRFPDGSAIEPAFEYHWRMWSIPEIREVLDEVGFARSVVYWEGSTKGGKGNSVYRRAERGTADFAWVAYVVGVK